MSTIITRRAELLGSIVAALAVLCAPPAGATGDPVTINRGTSAFPSCREGSLPSHRTGTQQIKGATSTWTICWNDVFDAEITGRVEDTAADGKSARVYVRFQHWQNPIEGWHWHEDVRLNTASGNGEKAYYQLINLDRDLNRFSDIRAVHVKTCAGYADDTCTAWG
ncbi:hypothetical protein AB0H12_41745 [Actinosynnema sp. NPDC023794]